MYVLVGFRVLEEFYTIPGFDSGGLGMWDLGASGLRA